MNNTFWRKIKPTLVPNISGTKCDGDQWIFLQKEGVNQIVMGHKIETQSDRKTQTRGSSPRNLPTILKYRSMLPGTY